MVEEAEGLNIGRDYQGRPGWSAVDQFAEMLLNTNGLCLSDKQVVELNRLHGSLSDFDKKPMRFV